MLDPFKLILVAVLALAALWVWAQVRQQVIAPIDTRVTEAQCDTYGEQLGQELANFERSNRFGLQNRSEGFCSFAAGPDGEPAVTVALADTEPGALYRMAKLVGIIVQLGVVSIFLRLVVDPVFEAYRYVRSKLVR